MNAALSTPTPSALVRISTSPAPGAAIGHHPIRVCDQAQRDQPVDRFDAVDRMAAGDRHARLRADLSARRRGSPQSSPRTVARSACRRSPARKWASRPSRRHPTGAFAAAIRPKSVGSSTTGMKKSCGRHQRLGVVQLARPPRRRWSRAPTSRSLNTPGAGMPGKYVAEHRGGRSCTRSRRRGRGRSGGARPQRWRLACRGVLGPKASRSYTRAGGAFDHARHIEVIDRADPETLAPFDAIIDVRSPSEFAEDHVPGAIQPAGAR